MGFRGAPGDSDDGSPGIGIPVGRAEADQGRNKVDAAGVLHGTGQGFCFRRILNNLQAVAQPLDRSADNKLDTFNFVEDFAIDPNKAGGGQAVEGHRPVTGAEGEDAGGPVGHLAHSLFKAGLAKETALLVANIAGNGDGGAKEVGISGTKHGSGGQHLGRLHRLDPQVLSDIIVPLQFINIEHHGTGGVGVIGDKPFAARQLIDQPGVDIAEGNLALFCPLPYPGDIFQDPFYLGGREIGVDFQPGLFPIAGAPFAFLNFFTQVGTAAVLPDNEIVDWFTRFQIPYYRRFPLVGNTDGHDIFGCAVGILHGLGDGIFLGLPDLIGVMFDPARLGIDLGKLLLPNAENVGIPVEDQCTAAGGTAVNTNNVLAHQYASFAFASALPNDSGIHYWCRLSFFLPLYHLPQMLSSDNPDLMQVSRYAVSSSGRRSP